MSRLAPDHTLHVVMNGQVVGDVQRTGTKQIRLLYAEPTSTLSTPLSLSMPLSTPRHRTKALAPWLEGLLPDRPETVRQWRRQFGVKGDDPISLLKHVGEDLAGAAQFVRPDRLSAVLADSGATRVLSEGDVAEMIRRAKADLPVSLDDSSDGKFSLAGAQAKIALRQSPSGWTDPCGRTPSTHILKPAIPGMEDQDLVEHVTMRTAEAIGLGAAMTRVETFGDIRALVVTRYDRVADPTGTTLRVHQEDMCQALGVWPFRKYESQGGPSAPAIADLIKTYSSGPSGDDNRRFARGLVFNWLMCGTDAHARNYSMLLSRGTARLAPLYDLNSHLAYADGSSTSLSMSINGVFHAAAITYQDWSDFAPSLHVDEGWLRDEITRQKREVLEAATEAVTSTKNLHAGALALDRLLGNLRSWLGVR